MPDYTALIAKYFPASQVQNAIAVMNGESGGDANAHNTSGEDSRGLFQINVSPSANPDLAKYNLFDPETNIRIAAQMQKERGWQPWTAAQKLGITDGSSSGGEAMAGPNTGMDPISSAPVYGFDKKGNPILQPYGGIAGQFQGGPIGYWETYADGQVWFRPADGSEPIYRYTDPQMATGYRAENKPSPDFTLNDTRYTVDPETGQAVPIAFGTDPIPRASENDMYEPGYDASGEPIRNPKFDWSSYEQEQRLREAQIANQQRLASGVSAATPRTAFPWEEQKGWLDVEKAKRDLMNPYLLQQQQVGEMISHIQGQLARGEIDLPTANRLMALARQNTDAAMRGTTPFQMDKQRQDLARQVTNDNMTTSSNMASNLLSGLGGIYGKILGNTNPPALDPLAMAQDFTKQVGPGPQINDLAKQLLLSALSPQGGL